MVECTLHSSHKENIVCEWRHKGKGKGSGFI